MFFRNIINLIWEVIDSIYYMCIYMFDALGLDFRLIVITMLCTSLVVFGIIKPFLANANRMSNRKGDNNK